MTKLQISNNINEITAYTLTWKNGSLTNRHRLSGGNDPTVDHLMQKEL